MDFLMSQKISRRDVLRVAGCMAVSSASGALAGSATQVASPTQATRPATQSALRTTFFYQFNEQAMKALTADGGLPSGSQYLHIFSHSAPGLRNTPEMARLAHSRGSSFRYAHPFDIHKYSGWMTCADDELKRWAAEFRKRADNPDGPADYFAFNEMPTNACSDPHVRERLAKLMRYIAATGDQRGMRGIFFMTEKNLNFRNWIGEPQSFFAAIDETCDLVVGEHYHSFAFVTTKMAEEYASHLFEFPRWLIGRKNPECRRVAEEKFVVCHSSFYGTKVSGWAGVDSHAHDEKDLAKYFDDVIAATRAHPLGRDRIGFGPLVAEGLDSRAVTSLAHSLGMDLRA
ncbi:MAG TPA: hypothetical protein VGN12_25495 [Pirellulales bacterium]|jgi:hypothetical protein